MNWFYNLKTSLKLTLAFGLCIAVTTIIGGVAANRMAQMDRITSVIVADPLKGVQALANFDANARQLRIVEYRHILSDSRSDRSAAEK